MLCPYPTTCEYDDYAHSGNHICMHVSCPYSLSVRRYIEGRVISLSSRESLTQRELDELVLYRRALESG